MLKPIDLWQAQCVGKVTGLAMPAGHFIPEELPADTANTLKEFFDAH
jgi:haloacetate dehalogenase